MTPKSRQTGSALVSTTVAPGLVPVGWADGVLERAAEIDDPAILWDGATTCAALAQKWNGHGQEKKEIKSAQMYVEVELGQRLGPNPGWGNQHQRISHAKSTDDLPIPPPRAVELRRFYGHRDLLIEEIRNGALSRRRLLLAVDRAEAEQREPVDADDLEIVSGDFRDVLAGIDPGTVALVLTDPPYPRQYLPLWSDLGKHSAQWLVNGGSLVTYCGQSIMPDAMNRLGEHLRYWWTLALTHTAGTQMLPGKFVSVGWKPLLWYVNEQRRDRAMIPDRITGSPPRKTTVTGDDGTWAQGIDELEPLISGLTAPGDLIVDPFAGSGTVGLAATKFGRRFIGAEIGGES